MGSRRAHVRTRGRHRPGRVLVALAAAVVSACTTGHGGSGTGTVSAGSGPAAFGGAADRIPVTSGQTGKDWWTWASSASIPTESAAVPAQTAQRYLVLDFWLKGSIAAVDKVDPTQVIAAVGTGNGAQQLSDDANLGSGLAAGGAVGGDLWGYVASQTATEASTTVVICTVSSDRQVGGMAKPSPAILADAITKNGPGAWTFHVFKVDGAWRVDNVADPSSHLPSSCQGWYAGLRAQAGLPAK